MSDATKDIEEWFGGWEAAQRNVPREHRPGQELGATPENSCSMLHTHGFSCTLLPDHGGEIHLAEGVDHVVAVWRVGGQYDTGEVFTLAKAEALFAELFGFGGN